MLNLKRLSLIAALAALPAAPAMAASSTSATLENFSITLFDLAPNDGVTPWITLAIGGLGSTVSVTAHDAAVGSDSLTRWKQSYWEPVSVGTTVGLAQASASVSGSPDAGTGRLAASGAALGVVPGTQFYDSTSFSARAVPSDNESSFLLSPYTLAVFSATASVRAQTTVGYDPATGGSEYASANVQLSVQGPAPGGGSSNGGQSASDSRFVYANSTTIYDPNTGGFIWTGVTEAIDASPVAVAFTNYSPGSLDGTLRAEASVSGNSAVTAVPEPGSVLLMLAGLAGMVPVVTRRRR